MPHGEEAVGRRLATLADSWKVLHGVVLSDKGTDIDHVVIGPGGVSTLNTKNHAGGNVTVYERALYVNGHQTLYVQKSKAEARRATRLLSAACGCSVAVEPVVVVMCSRLTVRGYPSDVHVVRVKGITRWLSGRPGVLTPDAVAHVYALARRDAAWH